MSIPHRFSESAFRKYEPYIKRIADEFPSPVTIDPRRLGLASETVRGRLRDAITSAINNRWPKSDVNYGNLLHADVNGLVVSLRPDGLVVVGTKETIKDAKQPALDSIIESNEIFDATEIVANAETSAEVCLLAKLAAEKQLKNKVKIQIEDHNKQFLLETYDIILEMTDTPYTYLLS